MESYDSFATIANVRLPSTSRILRSSWCPDKDLLVIILRTAGRDKLTLWKMQGSKKWEVDIDKAETIVDVAWNPDGTIIAVAHHPPSVTLHSVQDGSQIRSLSITINESKQNPVEALKGIWWLPGEREKIKDAVPDIFKRNNDITGSTHSLLKTQPLLDPLHDEIQSTSTGIFGFQGAQLRSTSKVSQPSIVSSWPTLPRDLLAASIQPTRHDKESRPGEEYDEVDDSNVNSILVVADDIGNLHYFLDGSYPLGATSFGDSSSYVESIYVDQDVLFAHSTVVATPEMSSTALNPAILRMPLLKQRSLRDMARLSSAAKELTWYAIRVVKEMYSVWFGSDISSGARELGSKWVKAFETRQKDQFGRKEPNAILDLTTLLVTGRASDALADYLGSGEQMSDRGIQKWETIVTEALMKLRDYSEKRFAPACQRLHLVLQELQGWSQLQRYAPFALDLDKITRCIDMTTHAIICGSWLASASRKELVRFKEFILWIRYEISRTHTAVDAHNQPIPRHDLIEVNDYLVSGLVVSSIDRWFSGLAPNFTLASLDIPDKPNLEQSLAAARQVLKNTSEVVWPPKVKNHDFSQYDRNLDALTEELALECLSIFINASKAASRSGIIVCEPKVNIGAVGQTGKPPSCVPKFIRERTVNLDSSEDHNFSQFLAISQPLEDGSEYFCMIQLRHGYRDSVSSVTYSAAVLECVVPSEEGGNARIKVLDAEFFDDELLVLVYRAEDGGETFIGTAEYANLAYQEMDQNTHVKSLSREDVVSDLLGRLRNGQVASVELPIGESRVIGGCREGGARLAVNGRVGRRVACVLDEGGETLEILDMEGEIGEEEEMDG
ncbi:anaphase-promoting complex, cyclosome, subunit 4-domain-containing protein [Abortiporus biennis]|nr:anaphase-promoting complex, cyclosome, subunit 4-domain-containing protein [Abortiporus biennis]